MIRTAVVFLIGIGREDFWDSDSDEITRSEPLLSDDSGPRLSEASLPVACAGVMLV